MAKQSQRDLVWYVPTMRDHWMTDWYVRLPLVRSTTQCSLLCACMCICMYVSTHMHRNVRIHVEATGQSWLSSLSSNYLLKRFIVFVIVCACACACVQARYVHMCTDICKGQKKPSHPLKLELQAVSSLLMWVLRTRLGSSAIAIHVFNYWSITQNYTVCLSVCLFVWGDRVSH